MIATISIVQGGRPRSHLLRADPPGNDGLLQGTRPRVGTGSVELAWMGLMGHSRDENGLKVGDCGKGLVDTRIFGKDSMELAGRIELLIPLGWKALERSLRQVYKDQLAPGNEQSFLHRKRRSHTL